MHSDDDSKLIDSEEEEMMNVDTADAGEEDDDEEEEDNEALSLEAEEVDEDAQDEVSGGIEKGFFWLDLVEVKSTVASSKRYKRKHVQEWGRRFRMTMNLVTN